MSVSIYRDTLDSALPDHVYEEFWVDLKSAATNASQGEPKFITDASAVLNKIRLDGQAKDKQNEDEQNGKERNAWLNTIRLAIDGFLYDYLMSSLESSNHYHHGILLNYIKRWNKICLERGHHSGFMLQFYYEITQSFEKSSKKMSENQQYPNPFIKKLLETSKLGTDQVVLMLIDGRHVSMLNRLLNNIICRHIVIEVFSLYFEKFKPCKHMKTCDKLIESIHRDMV